MLARSAFCMKNCMSVLDNNSARSAFCMKKGIPLSCSFVSGSSSQMKNLAKTVNDHQLGVIVCTHADVHVHVDGFEKYRSTSRALLQQSVIFLLKVIYLNEK
jgi:hypothetical protein